MTSSTSRHDACQGGRDIPKVKTKKSSIQVNPLLNYSLVDLTLIFSNLTPPKNTPFNVGVVHLHAFRPDKVSNAEQKVIKAIGNNQYQKFTKSEACFKDVPKFEESCGLDENI